MSHSKVTVKDSDLSTALSTAVSDLLKVDTASVKVELPDGVRVSDVKVKLSADVGSADQSGQSSQRTRGGSSSRQAAASSDAPAAVDDQPSGDQPSGDQSPESHVEPAEDHGDQLDREVDAAADFVEGLLDAMDLAGELELRLNVEEQSAEVEVVNMDNGALIGRRGSTLESIQELMRCALQSQFERRVRITVDVEGYRARRLEKLLDKADEAIDDVLDSGESVRLEPMDVFERKAVHELVGTVDGVASRSQGREPSRRVVIEASDD